MKWKDNKGFSLVELIISMAVLAIVSLAIMVLVQYGTRSYTYAKSELNLQMEAQTLLAQINTMIQESNYAEYDAAKEAQGMLEMKISQLKDLVANARIIDESKLNTEEVQLLNTVTIKNVKNGATMKYTIVAESEANLREGKLSSKTPIALGLMGHKVGEIVEVKAPAGMMQFEIVKIEI